MKRRFVPAVWVLATMLEMVCACERQPPKKAAQAQASGNEGAASAKNVPLPSGSSEKPSAGIAQGSRAGWTAKAVAAAPEAGVAPPGKSAEVTAKLEAEPKTAPAMPSSLPQKIPEVQKAQSEVPLSPLRQGQGSRNSAPLDSAPASRAVANAAVANPVPVSPQSLDATPANLSGNWRGTYTVQPGNQVVTVNVHLEDHTDSLNGTLFFDPGGATAAACAVSGYYNPQRKFMVLMIGACQGRAPSYLQGGIGFSSVRVTDRRVVGVEPRHNGVMDISR